MTDHSVYEEQICALLDGELSADEEASLRAHLDGCSECRAFFSAMEAVYGLAAKDLPEAPADLAQTVMAHVRAEARPEDSRTRIFRFPYRPLAAAAAAAAALVLWAGARSLPIFHAKSADSALSAAGAVHEFSVSSVQAEEAVEQAAETGTYGTVNGALFDEAEEDVEEAPSADAPAAVFNSAASAEGARDAGNHMTIKLHGSEILLDGKPVTLEDLEAILAEADIRATGVELICDGAAGETETSVIDLLSRLEVPVL